MPTEPDKFQVILAELQSRWSEDWPVKAFDRYVELLENAHRVALSPEEFEEKILLEAWILKTIRDGISFQEMMQNAQNL